MTDRQQDHAAVLRRMRDRAAEWGDGNENIAALDYALGALADAEKLRGFVVAILPMDADWIGDVDGGTLQDAAEVHGLIARTPVTEPCGEACNCAEVGDFPQDCFRPTPTMKRAQAAARATPPQADTTGGQS